MLSLKNLLTKSTPAIPPVPSAAGAEALTKGKQLLKGRTRAKVEALTADLDAARLALAQAEQIVADQIMEELDVTTAMVSMRQAGDRVRTLEIAVASSKEKDAIAQTELQDAERDAKRESLRALLTELGSAARTADEQMAAMGQTATKAAGLIQRIDAMGIGELNSRLVSVVGWFRIRLLDSCESMPGCWTGQDLFKKRESWASHVPSPDEADRLIK